MLPPAAAARADRPLDPVALAKLAELDPGGASGLLGRVLGTFLRSGTRMRHDLEAGWRAGDLPAVKLVAHTLKSSSAQIGALRLSQACAALEHAIDTRQTAPLAGLIADFGRELDATFRTIATMTAAGGPAGPTR